MDQFYFSRTTFNLLADEPMILPEIKNSMFRGGFGHIFKSFNCANKLSPDCSKCLLRETCIYTYIFAGVSPEQKPKPYVICADDTNKRFFKKGEIFSFELLLFGNAINYLPHFIFSFIELGKRGISKSRNKFSLSSVQDYDGTILFKNNKLLKSAEKQIISLLGERSSVPVKQLSLNFKTPLRLTYFGDLVVNPTFEMLIKAITRRLSSLCETYCGFSADIDYQYLIERAKTIRVLSNRLIWKDWSRYSSRQHSKMKFGGLMGTIVFSGDMEIFLPYLKIGSLIHIGKNCVFGNGKYEIVEDKL